MEWLNTPILAASSQVEEIGNIVANLGPTGLLGLAIFFLGREYYRVRDRLEKSEAARLLEAQSSNKTLLETVKALKEAGLLSLPSKIPSSTSPPRE